MLLTDSMRFWKLSVETYTCYDIVYISVLYTEHIIEACCLFEVKVRRIVHGACLYLMPLYLPSGAFLSVCPCCICTVDDAPAPLWLQHNVECVSHEKGAIYIWYCITKYIEHFKTESWSLYPSRPLLHYIFDKK